MKKWNNRTIFIVLILSTLFLNILYANSNLTQKQVFDKFKKVMSTDEYLDNYDIDYEDFLEDLKPEQKKLATEIFNENIEDFNKLRITPKTKIYNAILYWLATLANPKYFEWKIATEKLSSISSTWIRIDWKLSELISLFRQHWEEFQKIADKYWKELELELKKSREELKKEQEGLKKEQEGLKKYNELWKTLKELDKLLK